MKIFQQIGKLFGAILLASVFVLSGINPVSAADEDTLPQYRLQISPAKIDIGDLKPG